MMFIVSTYKSKRTMYHQKNSYMFPKKEHKTALLFNNWTYGLFINSLATYGNKKL